MIPFLSTIFIVDMLCRLLIPVLILLGLFMASTSNAQNEEVLYYDKDTAKEVRPTVTITQTDGSIVIGTLIEQTPDAVTLETAYGQTIIIPKTDVFSIRPYKKRHSRKIQESGYKLGGRYLFLPNAIPIEKGETYLHVNYYLGDIQFSISDHVSMGVGAGVFGAPLYIMPRIGIRLSKKSYLGLGSVVGSLSWVDIGAGGGLLYGMYTYGNQLNNASVGIGYGGGWGATFGNRVFEAPIIIGGGNFHLGASITLFFEGYVGGDGKNGIVIPGIRWKNRNDKYWGIGAGQFFINGTLFPLPIPFVSYSYVF